MEGSTTSVRVQFADLPPGEYQYRVEPRDRSGQVDVQPRHIVFRLEEPDSVWRALNLTGRHLGHASVRVSGGRQHAELPVGVVRSNRRLDRIFAYSVATLVSLTYVNMGCTLDLAVIRQTLLRPVGPAIGVITQYAVMPLVSTGSL